jgi:hypothetical protein
MIAEIGAGLSSAKALIDIAKGLHAAATQAEVNEVKIALQGEVLNIQAALMAAQAAESASTERIHELEQEIVRLKDWEGEKQRYELVRIDNKAVAYMAKAGMERGEPPHWLCTKCFNHGVPSIMQFQGTEASPRLATSYGVYRCNECGGTLRTHFRTTPAWVRSPA